MKTVTVISWNASGYDWSSEEIVAVYINEKKALERCKLLNEAIDLYIEGEQKAHNEKAIFTKDIGKNKLLYVEHFKKETDNFNLKINTLRKEIDEISEIDNFFEYIEGCFNTETKPFFD